MTASVDRDASIDARIIGEKRILSYRTLSSELGISVRESQEILRCYAERNSSNLIVTWAISTVSNGIRRLSLVRGDPSSISENGDLQSVSIWAIASANFADPTGADAWVLSDRLREIQLAKDVFAPKNELRDNLFNSLRSESAGWNKSGAGTQRTSKNHLVPADDRQLTAKSVNGPGAFRPSTLAGPNHDAGKKRPALMKIGTVSKASKATKENTLTSSLVNRTSSFGHTVLNKESSRPKPVQKRTTADPRKKRRVVEDSDEEKDGKELSDHEDSKEASEDEEERQDIMDEDEEERVDMSQEGSEDEASNMDRAEDSLEKDDAERKDSEDDVEDEGRPQLQPKKRKNSSDDDDFKDNTLSKENHLKGMLRDLQSNSNSRKRYRRKLVEVQDTDEKGYITTRMVTKFIDDEGNERPEESGTPTKHPDPEEASDANDSRKSSLNSLGTKRKAPDSLQNKRQVKQKNGKPPGNDSNKRNRSGAVGEGGKPEKAVKSGVGAKASGKKKIGKSSIMSYFGKKA